MSSEKYFCPVKDLISDEKKLFLRKQFWDYEHTHVEHHIVLNLKSMKRHWNNRETVVSLQQRKGYDKAGIGVDFLKEQVDFIMHEAKRWNREYGESFRADIIGLFIESNNLNCTKETLKELLDAFEKKYVSNSGYIASPKEGANGSVWGRFHTSMSNEKMFENTEEILKLCELYNSNDWCFLHTSGPRTTIAKHVDPLRQATLTFPLEPELEIYRNLNYYESFDDEEPSHIVDYYKINTCVLLNNQEIHSIEDNDPSMSGKPTLCFQINYFNMTYLEVKNMLNKKGLLLDV
jgi:hypothetical protein